ncbi:uncharacterized protein L3040_008492 [Drepanopeziza brunnea f. sp. 'multigermtubi']|uniref:uncharacterized protein n=1 Tax=Drepanopeziza brunnea f. sp. 'multigermtubi' TaxID=698441 RepID=UPI002387C448|nr:hypothetical protein L3040_008492 [Drepanopeziza brunnea f. sp. 'multigermtubi']
MPHATNENGIVPNGVIRNSVVNGVVANGIVRSSIAENSVANNDHSLHQVPPTRPSSPLAPIVPLRDIAEAPSRSEVPLPAAVTTSQAPFFAESPRVNGNPNGVTDGPVSNAPPGVYLNPHREHLGEHRLAPAFGNGLIPSSCTDNVYAPTPYNSPVTPTTRSPRSTTRLGAQTAVGQGNSPLYDEDVLAILDHDHAKPVLANVPTDEGTLGDVLYSLASEELKLAANDFRQDGISGLNDGDFLDQAYEAHVRRGRGDFEDMLETKFNTKWATGECANGH